MQAPAVAGRISHSNASQKNAQLPADTCAALLGGDGMFWIAFWFGIYQSQLILVVKLPDCVQGTIHDS